MARRLVRPGIPHQGDDMSANPDDQVRVLMEAAIRHEEVLEELAGAMKSTAASVAALTALMTRGRRDRSQGPGRRDVITVLEPPPRRPDPPDEVSPSVEHQALLSHCD